MVGITSTETLKREHHHIQRAVAAMVLLADRLETGREVKPETVQEAVGFMRLVYQSHEKKEELHLFPELQRKGISLLSVTARALVEEHLRGRLLVAQLEEAIASGDVTEASRHSLVASVRGLATLYPLHIWQEDLLLFHLADNALTPKDHEILIKRFDVVDEAAGGDVPRRLEQIANRLEKAVW